MLKSTASVIKHFTPTGAYMSTKKEWLILVAKTLIRVLIGTLIAFVVLKLIGVL